MDETLKKFVVGNLDKVPVHWSHSTQADELAQWAIGDGLVELPDPGETGNSQKIFDRALEDAYAFLRAEIYHYLSNRTFRDIVLEKAKKGKHDGNLVR